MKRGLVAALLSGIAVLALVGYGAYHLGLHAGQTTALPTVAGSAAPQRPPQKPGDIDPRTGKRVLYWQDPMVPAQRFDHPGKSPLMNMPLVPVEEGAQETGGVEISPRVEQNLGVRTAPVTRGRLAHELTATATVAYDERDVALVQARANGFIEHLRVRAPLDAVRKGEPLADLYVPDWVAAQEEYLTVKTLKSPDADGLLADARDRLQLAGMTDDLIEAFLKSGRVQARFTVTAPISGVVSQLDAREGMTVMNGAPLFRINGLSTVWVNGEVPESLEHEVQAGAAVTARTPALPGVVFDGKVSAVLPSVSLATRTLTARVALANPKLQLLPGMFVALRFASARAPETLLVPSEAVIQTGTRSVVMLAEGEGRFRPVDVTTGSEGGGQTEILSGLTAGEKVVVSGQFLIDSEASLKATEGRLQ